MASASAETSASSASSAGSAGAAGAAPRRIRVGVIEDETLLAKMLGRWLGRLPDVEIVGYATEVGQGLELCRTTRPDLVLLDVDLADGDGLALAQRLREELPKVRVLVTTGRVDAHTAWRAVQAGVHGLTDKCLEPEILAQTIRLVAGGGHFVSQAFQEIKSEWLTKPDAFQKLLSNRELEVLRSVVDGQSDEVIGKSLGISPDTVAGHRKSIRKKLGLHDDLGLVAYGRARGIYHAGALQG